MRGLTVELEGVYELPAMFPAYAGINRACSSCK